MNLTISNITSVEIKASARPNTVDLHIEGVMPFSLLSHVDITNVVEYYEITGLLDTIGENQIRSYLTLNDL